MMIFAGYTAFEHKLDALLFVLGLECNTGDRQRSIQSYGERVISNLSDQGQVEYACFSTSRLKTHQF